jgi:hypothetical protein
LTATPPPKAISLIATAIKTFKPTDSNDYLLPTVSITHTFAGGYCLPGSNTIGSSGFRCFTAQSVILDPCFPTFIQGMEVVTCMEHPWDNTVVEMTPTSPLPTLQDTGDSQADPWGIQLSSGARCTSNTGALDTFQGQPVRYQCDGSVDVVGDIGGQGALRTAGVVRVDPKTFHHTWLGIYQLAIEWLPKVDSTEPTAPATALDGSAIAAFIEQQTGDSSVQCPRQMPIRVGATYTCPSTREGYVVRVLSTNGQYSVSYY